MTDDHDSSQLSAETANRGAPGAGRLSREDGRGVVTIDKIYPTTVDDLWSAIVDPARLARWYGQVEGDLRPGGQFRTRIDAADLDGVGRIEVCEPPSRLVVTTRETEESWRRGRGPAPFDETVEAQLSEVGDGARLVIEVRGLPLDRLAAYGAGWQMQAEALADHLAGAAPADLTLRWQALLDHYDRLAGDLD